MINNAPMVRLGDYIEECDERNSDNALTLDALKGISTSKVFIETKANMDGVSLTSYKIVAPREFAYVSDTSRRGDKIALAFNNEKEKVLISSIYTVFRSQDENVLSPEYLYLLFNRSEFDRYSRFNSWGSARETFDWAELCRVEIPLPSIETQRALVAIYDGLQKTIAENEALIKEMESVCHAFVVDCKTKYPKVKLGEWIEECDERNTDKKLGMNDVIGMTITKEIIPTKADVKAADLSKFLIVEPAQFVYNPRTHGKKIGLGFNNSTKRFLISWNNAVFKVKDTTKVIPQYLYLIFCRNEWDRNACFRSWGSSTEVFSWSEFSQMDIPLPPIELQRSIAEVFNCLQEAKRIVEETRELMKNLCPALVQKATHST